STSASARTPPLKVLERLSITISGSSASSVLAETLLAETLLAETVLAATSAGVERGNSGACSWKKQREVRPSPISISGGSAVRHWSCASAHLGANTQPARPCPGVGRKPGMVSSL